MTHSSRSSSTSYCLLCSSECSELSTWRGGSTIGDENTQVVQSSGGGNEEGECVVLKAHVENMFVLLKLLDVPSSWCEERLRCERRGDGGVVEEASSVGPPASWFSVCGKCLEGNVKTAWRLHQKILALEAKMVSLKERVKEEMRRGIMRDDFDSRKKKYWSKEETVDLEIRRLLCPDLFIKAELFEVEIEDDLEFGWDVTMESDDSEKDDDESNDPTFQVNSDQGGEDDEPTGPFEDRIPDMESKLENFEDLNELPPLEKRGRGRPAKRSSSHQALENFEYLNELPPVEKRGRGRPPKKSSSHQALENFEDLNELPPLVKRGRGRPPKGSSSHQALENFEDLNELPPLVKRGRGRPPKGSSSHQALENFEDLNELPPVEKRGRGRPPKRTSLHQALENFEDLNELPPVEKRGRGRPPKRSSLHQALKNFEDLNELPPVEKRGRGRPPKGSSSRQALESFEDLNVLLLPAKRGRGRPPKGSSSHQTLENTMESDDSEKDDDESNDPTFQVNSDQGGKDDEHTGPFEDRIPDMESKLENFEDLNELLPPEKRVPWQPPKASTSRQALENFEGLKVLPLPTKRGRGRPPKGSSSHQSLLYQRHWGTRKKHKFHWKRCSLCDARYKTQDEYDAHQKVHEEAAAHPGTWEFNCSQCQFPARDVKELDFHIRTRHSKPASIKREYRCPKCPFTCVFWKILRIHADKEHGTEEDLKSEFDLKCDICGISAKNMQSLRRHMNIAHQECSEKITTDNGGCGITATVYECPECQVKFPSQRHLQSHIQSIHRRHARFVCDKCGKGYEFPSALEAHKLSHVDSSKKGEYICHLCGLDYHDHVRLGNHINKAHRKYTLSPPKQEFKCTYCEVTSPFRFVIQRHLESHKELLGNRCKECGKMYMNAQALKRHIRINHSSESWPCPHCLKTFPCEEYVKDHVKKFCKLKNMVTEGANEIPKSEPNPENVDLTYLSN